jgi:colanic acid/amylovoran biosynthesis glycosyltransferase
MHDVTLVVVSPLKGVNLPNGNIMLTQKFVDGMALYRKLWKGPIRLFCEPADRPSNNLDNVEVGAADFQTQCADLTDDVLRLSLPSRSLVLSSVGEQFNRVSRICREMGLPCVYITEYSLRTRLQIIEEYRRNFPRRTWAKLRQVQQELAQRKAIANSAGVQCNGLPTYQTYKGISPNPHLFFDSRIEEEMLANRSSIERRISQMKSAKKIRLLFSGRLDLMKGVNDLPIVADR